MGCRSLLVDRLDQRIDMRVTRRGDASQHGGVDGMTRHDAGARAEKGSADDDQRRGGSSPEPRRRRHQRERQCRRQSGETRGGGAADNGRPGERAGHDAQGEEDHRAHPHAAPTTMRPLSPDKTFSPMPGTSRSCPTSRKGP